jgi:hypothetical protein
MAKHDVRESMDVRLLQCGSKLEPDVGSNEIELLSESDLMDQHDGAKSRQLVQNIPRLSNLQAGHRKTNSRRVGNSGQGRVKSGAECAGIPVRHDAVL